MSSIHNKINRLQQLHNQDPIILLQKINEELQDHHSSNNTLSPSNLATNNVLVNEVIFILKRLKAENKVSDEHLKATIDILSTFSIFPNVRMTLNTFSEVFVNEMPEGKKGGKDSNHMLRFIQLFRVRIISIWIISLLLILSLYFITLPSFGGSSNPLANWVEVYIYGSKNSDQWLLQFENNFEALVENQDTNKFTIIANAKIHSLRSRIEGRKDEDLHVSRKDRKMLEAKFTDLENYLKSN